MKTRSAAWRLALLMPLASLMTACATPAQSDRPHFAQRAAPAAGEYEIELLAGLSGTLAIENDCLGVQMDRGGEVFFTTLVWPWNARLERGEGRWQVRNVETGEIIGVGERISGSGGFNGGFDADALRRYNRMLVEDLSARCAKTSFSLNRAFGRD